MSSVPAPISPGKLRSDIFSFTPHNADDPTPPLVISVLASLLERAIARSERTTTSGEPPEAGRRCRAFDSDRVLDMTVQSFLERIFRYSRAGAPVFVVAYVYLDRLCQLNPSFRISSSNVHRLLVTTVMTASKFLEDINYRNSHFARIGGLTTEEMNRLEVDFLFMMSFKLHVNVSIFQSYCSHLEREVSAGGGYQIERSLRFMCGGEEITSKERERRRREWNQIARVL